MAKRKTESPEQPAEPVAMAVETVDISSISFDSANVRKRTQKNLDTIKASLARFGQQKPIVVDENNVVRAGNGTLTAALALGWKRISIVRSDLPLEELTAFAIVDNRSAELAEWDDDLLAAELGGLREDGFDLGQLGFDSKDLDFLLGEPSSLDESTESRNLGKNNTSATVKVVVAVPDLGSIERAIALCGNPNRGECLVEICRAYAEAKR